jgi:hypothetical protein
VTIGVVTAGKAPLVAVWLAGSFPVTIPVVRRHADR